MSHNIEIKEDAIIISDAHYSHHLRPELLAFFRAIDSQQIKTSQLLLFGDIFDALFGYIPYTYEQNKEVVALLQSISKKIEVVYLEGNHDFQLREIFSNITIFPLSAQPVACSYNNTQGYMAHGDFDGAIGYKIYCTLIRNSVLLRVLEHIDRLFNHAILKKIDNHLGKKDDCKEFGGFEHYIQKHIENYNDADFFIEGHHHQNKIFTYGALTYINLGAFACNQRYFRVKSTKDNKLTLQEKQFVGEKKDG